MTTSEVGILKAATQKMQWHETRQKVLAKNIANADTPNYIPQDIKKMDFKEMLDRTSSSLTISPTITNRQHISSSITSSNRSSFTISKDKNPYEVSPTGNSVVLEEQMLKINENNLDHRLTTTIYRKSLEALKKSVQTK